MTKDQQALIDFATRWLPFGGGDEYILPEFGITPYTFYQRLHALLQSRLVTGLGPAAKLRLAKACAAKLSQNVLGKWLGVSRDRGGRWGQCGGRGDPLGIHSPAPNHMPHLRRSMNAESAVPTISITDTALETIAREAMRSLDGLETGGILLGTDAHERIDIRHAGDPGPNAHRDSRTFLRDLDYAQQLADATWRHDRSQ